MQMSLYLFSSCDCYRKYLVTSQPTIKFLEEHRGTVAADSTMVHYGYPVSENIRFLHEMSRDNRRSMSSETLSVNKNVTIKSAN